jgi:hypothetical protein
MNVAGLVLAVFPVVINGLTGFADAVDTFRLLRGYRREVGRYARNIRREETTYIDTITELLEGFARSDLELKELIEDACGPLWKDPYYDEKLRARLDQSYGIYLETIKDMLGALEELKQKLGLVSSVSEKVRS